MCATGDLDCKVLAALQQLVSDCTAYDPEARPNFKTVVERIRKIQRLFEPSSAPQTALPSTTSAAAAVPSSNVAGNLGTACEQHTNGNCPNPAPLTMNIPVSNAESASTEATMNPTSADGAAADSHEIRTTPVPLAVNLTPQAPATLDININSPKCASGLAASPRLPSSFPSTPLPATLPVSCEDMTHPHVNCTTSGVCKGVMDAGGASQGGAELPNLPVELCTTPVILLFPTVKCSLEGIERRPSGGGLIHRHLSLSPKQSATE